MHFKERPEFLDVFGICPEFRDFPEIRDALGTLVNRQFVGTPEYLVGPLERTCDLQCLVMGIFGEASEHVYSMGDVMAESKLAIKVIIDFGWLFSC